MKMKRFLKRIRGIIGTGVTWALAWVGLGAVVGALVGYPVSFLFRIALSNSVSGFIAAAAEAAIIAVAERKHTLDDLSLKRVAVWGAIGGGLLSFVPMAYGVPLAYLLGPLVINGGIGAGMAAGSVAIARRSEDRRLASGPNDPLLSFEGD